MTDEAAYYTLSGREFASDDIVRHEQGKYEPGGVMTNIIEGFFSVFKHRVKAVHQHRDKKHLHRYPAEFEFRYNPRIVNGFNDLARANQLLGGFIGKRLN